MSNVTTTNIQSAFLAAEILVQMIGQEAAQRTNIMETVWTEDLVGDQTLSAHFRFVNPFSAISSATEATSLPSATWSPTGVVITAGLDGQSVIASKLVNSIAPEALGLIAQQSGTALGRAVDSSLAALFSSLTGGTVGTSGDALTVLNILTANANLDANHADEIGPYIGRLHPHAFLNLYNDIMSKNYGIAKVTVDGQGREQIVIGGTILQKNTLVPTINSGADNAGAVYVYQAMGLAIAQQPTVEVLPLPGQASWSIDATVAFGAGVVRPTLGCLVQSGKTA